MFSIGIQKNSNFRIYLKILSYSIMIKQLTEYCLKIDWLTELLDELDELLLKRHYLHLNIFDLLSGLLARDQACLDMNSIDCERGYRTLGITSCMPTHYWHYSLVVVCVYIYLYAYTLLTLFTSSCLYIYIVWVEDLWQINSLTNLFFATSKELSMIIESSI